MKTLSVITTLYCSENYIHEFYERTLKIIKKLSISEYEFIFVDDGSPDNSLNEAITIQDKDPNIIIIELSRNFGHHKAMMTGLKYAKEDYVFLIDIDLEEEPELLETFWQEITNDENQSKYDVIYGVQDKRKGKWFERLSGSIFYKIFNNLSGIKIPQNPLTARLMTKKYVESLLQYRDQATFIMGLAALAGFNQKPITCHKNFKGTTSYSLSKKIALAVNSITSFSSKPLYHICYMGFSISFISLLYIIYLIINKIFFAIPVTGWTSLIVSIYMLGGLILSSVGVIGIYIAKIFEEVKERPYTIIKKIWSK